MNPLLVVVIGVVLFGAVAFTAISNNPTTNYQPPARPAGGPTTNSSDYMEADNPAADGLSRSLQLETFTPNLSNNSTTTNTTVACIPGGKTAYNFVLDTSSSMTAANDGRFGDMKKDVVDFIASLQPDSVVAVQAFDSGAREIIAPSYLKDLDPKYAGKIKSLNPTESSAGTNTKAGLIKAKTVLDANRSKFPGYNWSFILVTDGCPNSSDMPTDPPDISKQIRDSGISLVGYGIKLGTAGKCGGLARKLGLPTGTKPIEAAKVLMEKITGSKDNYSLTEDETLASFLNKIPAKTCPPKPAPQACTPTNAPNLELLVDNSGSMESSMPNLKEALTNFGKNLTPNTIVGLHSFSGGGPRGVLQERFPIGKFNQTTFERGVNAMSEDENGATYMKDAFEAVSKKIEDYDTDSNYKEWTMIFLSDGNPKTLTGEDDDPTQDPSSIATKLKGKNMRIVSIALGNQIKVDKMKKIATNESKDFFLANNANELTDIYSKVFQAVSCQ